MDVAQWTSSFINALYRLTTGFIDATHVPNYETLSEADWLDIIQIAKTKFRLRDDAEIPTREQMQTLYCDAPVSKDCTTAADRRLASFIHGVMVSHLGEHFNNGSVKTWKEYFTDICSIGGATPILRKNSDAASLRLLRSPAHSKVPIVIVANHMGLLDGFALGALLGKASVLAGTTAFKTPFFGKVLEATDSIEVDADAKRDPIALHAKVANRLAGGCKLLVFPESTAQAGNQVVRFATGPFTHKAIYVPISIKMPAHLRMTCGNMTIAKTILATKIESVIPVQVLAMYDNRDERYSPAELRDKCQRDIATSLRWPIRNDLDHKTFLPVAMAYYRWRMLKRETSM